jgi:hypothetical protein
MLAFGFKHALRRLPGELFSRISSEQFECAVHGLLAAIPAGGTTDDGGHPGVSTG